MSFPLHSAEQALMGINRRAAVRDSCAMFEFKRPEWLVSIEVVHALSEN